MLLLMLLAVSIGSNVVVGVIGYLNGSDSLRQAAIDRLVEVRDSRSREVDNLFDSIEASLLLASRDSAVVNAEQAFAAGMRELDSAAIAADRTDSSSSGTQNLTVKVRRISRLCPTRPANPSTVLESRPLLRKPPSGTSATSWEPTEAVRRSRRSSRA